MTAASPDRAAFPELQAGRRPRLPFRGLPRLHTRYGLSSRSPAQAEVCSGASTGPVARPSRLPAAAPNRPLPGWDFHPRGERALRGAPKRHGSARRERASTASCRLPTRSGMTWPARAKPGRPPCTSVVLRALRGKILPRLQHNPSYPFPAPPRNPGRGGPTTMKQTMHRGLPRS